MTNQEFTDRSNDLLFRHDIPAALHAALVDFAYDQAHPDRGRALAVLEDLCWRLERPLFAYFKAACAAADPLAAYARIGGGEL